MKILQSPNKILHQKTKPVSKINDGILKLIGEMRETLDKVKGVGLAAPQIGQSISLAIVGFEPTAKMLDKNPKIKAIEKIVLINPKIIWCSKEQSVEKEGCLSCDKQEVDIPRYVKIHVEYLNEKGSKRKTKARGILARIIQHEIDHLEGRLITDYLAKASKTKKQ